MDVTLNQLNQIFSSREPKLGVLKGWFCGWFTGWQGSAMLRSSQGFGRRKTQLQAFLVMYSNYSAVINSVSLGSL